MGLLSHNTGALGHDAEKGREDLLAARWVQVFAAMRQGVCMGDGRRWCAISNGQEGLFATCWAQVTTGKRQRMSGWSMLRYEWRQSLGRDAERMYKKTCRLLVGYRCLLRRDRGCVGDTHWEVIYGIDECRGTMLTRPERTLW